MRRTITAEYICEEAILSVATLSLGCEPGLQWGYFRGQWQFNGLDTRIAGARLGSKKDDGRERS